MKPAPFRYDAARDIDHAIALFTSADGEARYIAGGQTLGPMLNLRLTQPDHLIDISRLESLTRSTDEGVTVFLGAGLRHAQIEDGEFPDPSAGFMPRVARHLAYRAVRNRGTIGGSLCHADPAAEWPNVLMALNAVVAIQGMNGSRDVPIDSFLRGYLTTAALPGEIVTGVRIPVLGAGIRIGYHKLCRQPGEFAEALAITVRDSGGAARCVLGCAGPVPLVLGAVSTMAGGMREWQPGALSQIAEALAQDLRDAQIDADPVALRMFARVVSRSLEEVLR